MEAEVYQVREVLKVVRDALTECITTDLFTRPAPKHGYVWIDIEFRFNLNLLARRDGFLLPKELYDRIDDDDLLYHHIDNNVVVAVLWNSPGVVIHVENDPHEVAIRHHYWRWSRPHYCDKFEDMLRDKHVVFPALESSSPTRLSPIDEGMEPVPRADNVAHWDDTPEYRNNIERLIQYYLPEGKDLTIAVSISDSDL